MTLSIAELRTQAPFFLLAGPCVIETFELCLAIAQRIKLIGTELSIPVVFKASFDKANRTSGSSFRGPGMEKGLQILQRNYTIKGKTCRNHQKDHDMGCILWHDLHPT